MSARSVRLGLAVVLAIAAAVAALDSRSVQSAASNEAIDRIFARWDRHDSPGCALAIYKDGKILYERGYGMADLEHDVPIAPGTVFYVGSLSKQFTAFAAALAIQQGRLALDDPIRRYLPELPEYAGSITVRHLIHHTSGLRDFYTLLSIAGRRQDALFDNPAILRMAARQKHLNFEAGADYLYSNTGYTLLAILVGRAAGTPFGAFAEAKIFKPLGMTASHFHDDEARLVKGRAYAYAQAPGEDVRLDTPGGERVGAGGVFTTVRDLLRWDENFYDGTVGGRALIDQIQTPGRLNDGRVLTYAWGLQLGAYRGLRIVEHGGSLGGYRAHLLRFPDQHVTVACLCNMASIAPSGLARQVADATLADRFTQPKPTGSPSGSGGGRGGRAGGTTPAAPSPPRDYAGTFYSDEIDATFILMAKDGQLTLRRGDDTEPTIVEPGSPDEFKVRGMTVRFERDSGRNVVALLVDAGRVRGIRFVRQGP